MWVHRYTVPTVHSILWVPTVPVPVYLCACVFGKDSQQAYMLKVRTSAEKVLKKCGKSAEKVRIGAEKVRESAEKCESDPFSHTNIVCIILWCNKTGVHTICHEDSLPHV